MIRRQRKPGTTKALLYIVFYHKVYIVLRIIVDYRKKTVDFALKNVFQEDMRGLSIEPMR
jgi:hypothetical protein